MVAIDLSFGAATMALFVTLGQAGIAFLAPIRSQRYRIAVTVEVAILTMVASTTFSANLIQADMVLLLSGSIFASAASITYAAHRGLIHEAKACRVSTEWTGRRTCSTHRTSWDSSGPCPRDAGQALS